MDEVSVGLADPIRVRDEADVAHARAEVRRLSHALGLDRSVEGRAALCVSELGMNQINHARQGELWVLPLDRGGVAGLAIRAEDRGPGITQPDRAFQGLRTASQGLGVGLAGVMNQSDELSVDIRGGEGTAVHVAVFAGPAAREPQHALLGRPHPDEVTSGGHGFVLRLDDGRTLLAVADGLGHGREARGASDAGLEALRRHASGGLDGALDEADRAAQGGRGLVLSVLRIDPSAGVAEFAGAGNVSTRVVGRGEMRELIAHNGVLGTTGRSRGLRRADGASPAWRVRTVEWRPGYTALMHTDGLSSRQDLGSAALIATQHPVITAGRLLGKARRRDDVFVAVVR